MSSTNPCPEDASRFLTLLSYDARLSIFNYLIRDRIIPILPPITRSKGWKDWRRETHAPDAFNICNDLTSLSRTCKQLRTEIEIWVNQRPQTLTRHPQFPQFGVFNPQTTTFMLDLREQIRTYNDMWSKRDCVQRRARETCVKLFRDNLFTHETMQHVIIDLRFSKRWRLDPYLLAEHQLFPLLQQLKNLSSCELILHDMAIDRSYPSILRLWKVFFESMDVCSPGECCTCCVLPELKVRIVSPRERKWTLPILPGEWDRYPTWEEHKAWYNTRVSARGFESRHNQTHDVLQTWFANPEDA